LQRKVQIGIKKRPTVKKRIFISHGKDLKPLDELKNMLTDLVFAPVLLVGKQAGAERRV